MILVPRRRSAARTTFVPGTRETAGKPMPSNVSGGHGLDECTLYRDAYEEVVAGEFASVKNGFGKKISPSPGGL